MEHSGGEVSSVGASTSKGIWEAAAARQAELPAKEPPTQTVDPDVEYKDRAPFITPEPTKRSRDTRSLVPALSLMDNTGEDLDDAEGQVQTRSASQLDQPWFPPPLADNSNGLGRDTSADHTLSPTEHFRDRVDVSPVSIDPVSRSKYKRGEETPIYLAEHSRDKGGQYQPLLSVDADEGRQQIPPICQVSAQRTVIQPPGRWITLIPELNKTNINSPELQEQEDL